MEQLGSSRGAIEAQRFQSTDLYRKILYNGFFCIPETFQNEYLHIINTLG